MSTPHRARTLAVAVFGVVDEAVSFSVVNRNTSALACPSDGHYFDLARQHEVALDGLASWIDRERL